MSRQCDNWNELFKGVQRLKKHVEEAHKKGSGGVGGVGGGGDGGGGGVGVVVGGGGGDDGGWVWQEAGGGVRGWTLVKVYNTKTTHEMGMSS